MNLAYAYWFSLTAFGLVVLLEHGHAVQAEGVTIPTGLGLLGGTLIVGTSLLQAAHPEKDIGGLETGRWTYVVIVGAVGYIAGVVIGFL